MERSILACTDKGFCALLGQPLEGASTTIGLIIGVSIGCGVTTLVCMLCAFADRRRLASLALWCIALSAVLAVTITAPALLIRLVQTHTAPAYSCASADSLQLQTAPSSRAAAVLTVGLTLPCGLLDMLASNQTRGNAGNAMHDRYERFRMASRSWRQLRHDGVDLLYLCEGTPTAAQERTAMRLGFRALVGNVERSEAAGAPTLRGLLRTIESHAQTSLVGFINADLLLFGLSATAHAASRAFGQAPFLLVGKRCSLLPSMVPAQWTAHPGAQPSASALRSACAGRAGAAFAIDWFVFPRGLYPHARWPDIVIGHFHFDNLLLGEAHVACAEVVDATDAVVAVHVDHPSAKSSDRVAGNAHNMRLVPAAQTDPRSIELGDIDTASYWRAVRLDGIADGGRANASDIVRFDRARPKARRCYRSDAEHWAELQVVERARARRASCT